MSLQPEWPPVQAESIAVPAVADPASLRDVELLLLWVLLSFLGVAVCLGTLIWFWHAAGHLQYSAIWLNPLAFFITPVVLLFAVRFSGVRFKPLWASVDLSAPWGWPLILGVGSLPTVLSFTLAHVYLGQIFPGRYLLQSLLLNGMTIANPWALGLALVGLVLVTPVMEELVFRGVIQPALTARWGPWVSIPVTTAIWALLHEWQWTKLLGIFSMGLCLGWMAHRRTHLTWCILAHAVTNAIAAVGMVASSLRYFHYFR